MRTGCTQESRSGFVDGVGHGDVVGVHHWSVVVMKITERTIPDCPCTKERSSRVVRIELGLRYLDYSYGLVSIDIPVQAGHVNHR